MKRFRIILTLIALYLCLSLFAAPVSAKTIDSGTCGDNLTWTLDDKGVLTISGQGKMAEYSEDSEAPWYEYHEMITELIIGENVASISQSGFRYFEKLERIRFNATAMDDSSDDGIFYRTGGDSPGITVVIGANVTRIPSYLFGNAINTPEWNVLWSGSGITSVIFEEGSQCESIGYSAFNYCYSLNSINIPESVTSIGAYAFYQCKNLLIQIEGSELPETLGSFWDYGAAICMNAVKFGVTDYGQDYWITEDNTAHVWKYHGDDTVIVIPDTIEGAPVTEIATSAFAVLLRPHLDPNGRIKYVEIPDSVKTIGSFAFEKCIGLEKIIIPESVEYIGKSAFSSCENVTEIRFNAISMNNFEYDNSVFYNVGKNTDGVKAIIGSKVTRIPDYMFAPQYKSNSSYYETLNLTTVEFEEGGVCESIGVHVFHHCATLTQITLPESLTMIGEDAFYNCTGLTQLLIPENVKTMGKNAFYNCTGLSTIQYNATAMEDLSGGGAFAYAGTDGDGIVVTIGANVTYIPGNLFKAFESSGTKITEVVFENGSRCTGIGSGAFSGCAYLTSIRIPETVRNFGYGVFAGSSGLTSAGPLGNGHNIEFSWTDAIPAYAFSSSNLSEVTLPDSISSIGAFAFSYCSGLSSIDLPTELAEIGEKAFGGCSGFTGISIPEKVETIGDEAFSNCTALTEIVFNAVSMNDLTSYNEVFYDAGKDGAGITVSIGAGVSKIPAFLFNPYGSSCVPNITSVVFEGNSNCRMVGEYAFSNLSLLTEIDIPESVMSIGTYAFRNCAALTDVTVPGGVTSIGEKAFYGCSSLTSTGPIGGGFSIEFGWTEAIPANAFNGCSSLTDISLPVTIKEIGEKAFDSCTSLTSVTIPRNVKTIGNNAFQNCISLEEVLFYATSMNDLTKDSNVFHSSSVQQDNGITVRIGSNVTRIPAYLFGIENRSLRSVDIKKVVFEKPSACTSIGSRAFYRCDLLWVIDYSGSQIQWEKINKGDGNDILEDATINYNTNIYGGDGGGSEGQSSRRVRYFREWDPEEKTAYFDLFDYTGSQVTEETDPEFLENVESLLNSYVLVETKPRDDNMVAPDTLISMKPVVERVGIVQASAGETVTIDGVTYSVTTDGLIFYEVGDIVRYFLYENEIVGEIQVIETETRGILNYWNKKTRQVRIGQDEYTLSDFADDATVSLLGETGNTSVAIRYTLHDGIVYKILRDVPDEEAPPNYEDFETDTPEEKAQSYLLKYRDDWEKAYKEFIEAVDKTLQKFSGTDEETRESTIAAEAARMKKHDKSSHSKYITGNLGVYKDQAYHALATFFYDYAYNEIPDISSVDLSSVTAGTTIINNIMKGMYGKSKDYTYGDVKISISVAIAFKSEFGSMTIYDEKTKDHLTVMVCSTQDECEETLYEYMEELRDLATNSAYNVASSVYKDILGKPLSSLTSDYMTKTVTKLEKKLGVVLSEKFKKAGVGQNLIGTLDECYTFYTWVNKRIGKSEDIMKTLDEISKLKFEDTTVPQGITKTAMKHLKKANQKMQRAFNEYLEGTIQKKEEGFFRYMFNCPVNVAIYNSAGEQIGYVGDDDIWYTEEIWIGEAGGAKEIISLTDEELTFEVVATDYGTMSCSFEEYDDSFAPIGRLNYYDIILEPNQTFNVSVPDNLQGNANTLAITSGDEVFYADEYISVDETASVIITCNPVTDDDVEAGMITGVGSHVRGDAVVLHAEPYEGFEFIGWFDGEHLVCVDDIYEFTARENVNLTARFYKDDFIYVNTEAESGGNAIGSGRYYLDDHALVIAQPNSGYVFAGWYVEDQLVSLEVEYSFDVSADTTLVAKFEEVSYDYGKPSFTWTEEHNCIAIFTNADSGDKRSVDCTVASETVVPSCLENGETVYTATVEFNDQIYTDTKTVTIDALGHSYEAVVTAPTCTEQGYTTNTCTRCSDSYVDGYTETKGHRYTDDEDNICEVCGYEREINTGILLGDVDGSGSVDFFDGMIILQYYAGIIDDTQLDVSAADVDISGDVNFFDGMYILQFYAGILEKLPVEA